MVDIAQILRNLAGVYDFSGRDVVYVGAGGGRLLSAVRGARRVQAVDRDAASLDALRDAAARDAFPPPLTLTHGDFAAGGCHPSGCSLDEQLNEWRPDVVYFEFCLHEMPDPAAALARALKAAPEVVVLDHDLRSPWAAMTGETERAAAAWAAFGDMPLRARCRFNTVQLFADYAELQARLAGLGPEAVPRMEPFRGLRDFEIPMSYAVAVVARSSKPAKVRYFKPAR